MAMLAICSRSLKRLLSKHEQRKQSCMSLGMGIRSFRPRSVRLQIESIRLRLICQFAYESDVEALNLNY